MDSLIPGGETPATETPAAEVTPQTETPAIETPATEVPGTETPATEAKFMFAEGVNGEGDVPEWFKGDKYKTVSAQAEAYTELESKLGSFTGAPKDGKYEIEGLDFEESPLLKLTAEWGAENQLSQDGLGSLIEKVNALAATQLAEDATNAKEALGENADKRLSDLSQWGKNNLSPEEFEQFQGLAQNAGHVEVLEKLIAKTKNSKLVEVDPTNVKTKTEVEELQEMQLATDEKGKRMMDNPAYRAKYNAKKAALSK